MSGATSRQKRGALASHTWSMSKAEWDTRTRARAKHDPRLSAETRYLFTQWRFKCRSILLVSWRLQSEERNTNEGNF